MATCAACAAATGRIRAWMRCANANGRGSPASSREPPRRSRRCPRHLICAPRPRSAPRWRDDRPAHVPRALGRTRGGRDGRRARRSGRTADADGDLATPSLEERVGLDGEHQAGIVTPRQPHAIFLALDAIADSRTDLADALRMLSVRGRFLTAGGTPPVTPEGIPSDSGILDPSFPSDRLTFTIGLGASLLDDRYRLRGRRPDGLVAMPTFPNDELDPSECHGDVLVQLCSGSIDTNLHALRDLMRATRDALHARWKGLLSDSSKPAARLRSRPSPSSPR